MIASRTGIRCPRLFVAALLLAASSLALFTGCADPEGAVGSSVGPGIGGSVETRLFYADTSISYTAPPVKTGGSAHLYVGSACGITAEALLRFHRPLMPQGVAPDTARDAVVRLAFEGGIGDGWAEVAAERLDLTWTEADSLTLDMLPQGVALAMLEGVGGADTGSVMFAVSADWIGDWLAWIDSSQIDTTWQDTTRGDSALTVRLFAPQSAGRLVRFRSRSALEDTVRVNLRPRLYIPTVAEDTVTGGLLRDSLTVVAAADLFIIQYEDSVARGRLMVGSGVPWRALLRFDVSDMWSVADSASVVINQAVVTLWRDTLLGPLPITPSVWPFKLTNDEWITDPTLMEQGSFTVIPTAVDVTLDSLRIPVTPAAREWIEGAERNFGLVLNSGGVGLDIDRIAFYPPQAPDAALRPRLTIHYTRLER